MDKTDLPPLTMTQSPTIDPSVFIASGARIMGDVTIEANASIWYNAVIRGDIQRICIGERTNIQDGCVLHVENDNALVIHHDVTVGHGAILHAATIEDHVMIGMGAIVLSGAKIGRGSVIGAGAVVSERIVIPPFSLVVGVPGKIKRTLPPETIDIHHRWAEKYVKLALCHASHPTSDNNDGSGG